MEQQFPRLLFFKNKKKVSLKMKVMGYILMCYSILVCIQDPISYELNIKSSKITISAYV